MKDKGLDYEAMRWERERQQDADPATTTLIAIVVFFLFWCGLAWGVYRMVGA